MQSGGAQQWKTLGYQNLDSSYLQSSFFLGLGYNSAISLTRKSSNELLYVGGKWDVQIYVNLGKQNITLTRRRSKFFFNIVSSEISLNLYALLGHNPPVHRKPTGPTVPGVPQACQSSRSTRTMLSDMGVGFWVVPCGTRTQTGSLWVPDNLGQSVILSLHFYSSLSVYLPRNANINQFYFLFL